MRSGRRGDATSRSCCEARGPRDQGGRDPSTHPVWSLPRQRGEGHPATAPHAHPPPGSGPTPGTVAAHTERGPGTLYIRRPRSGHIPPLPPETPRPTRTLHPSQPNPTHPARSHLVGVGVLAWSWLVWAWVWAASSGGGAEGGAWRGSRSRAGGSLGRRLLGLARVAGSARPLTARLVRSGRAGLLGGPRSRRAGPCDMRAAVAPRLSGRCGARGRGDQAGGDPLQAGWRRRRDGHGAPLGGAVMCRPAPALVPRLVAPGARSGAGRHEPAALPCLSPPHYGGGADAWAGCG